MACWDFLDRCINAPTVLDLLKTTEKYTEKSQTEKILKLVSDDFITFVSSLKVAYEISVLYILYIYVHMINQYVDNFTVSHGRY